MSSNMSSAAEIAEDLLNDSSITGRRRFLIQNGYSTDCEFLVGTTKAAEDSETESILSADEEGDLKLFKCHKSVLKSASEVFYSMFSDRYPNQPSPIVVNDVDPESFQTLINFIYEENLLEDVVNMANLEGLIYIAEKYLVKGFANAVVKQLDQLHWPDFEIWRIFQLSCFYKNMRLRKVAYKRIRQRAEYILRDASFCDLQPEYLKGAVIFLTESKACGLIDIKEAMETYAVINFAKNCKDYKEARNLILNR